MDEHPARADPNIPYLAKHHRLLAHPNVVLAHPPVHPTPAGTQIEVMFGA